MSRSDHDRKPPHRAASMRALRVTWWRANRAATRRALRTGTAIPEGRHRRDGLWRVA